MGTVVVQDLRGVTGSDSAVAAFGLAKSFGHVQALTDASVEVRHGRITALFGDNGAGKSTLLRCLLGIVHPDQGDLQLDGASVRLSSIRDAQTLGVEAVHQDLALAPDLSVVDNMFLGHEELRSGPGRLMGLLARRKMADRAVDALESLGIRLRSLAAPVADLSGGQRQAVAIARAVMWARTAVLLDEPTAALGARQSEIVCELLRSVAERQLGVLVISHDLPRVLAVADDVTILRRGSTIHQGRAAALSVPDVVSLMVGYEGGISE